MPHAIGLMSGTSVDGIDAALVKLTGWELDLKIDLLAAATYPYPPDLRDRILALCQGDPLPIAEFAALDDAIGHCFAEAALTIQEGQPPADFIGSHGQTVFHRPPVPIAEDPSLDGGRLGCRLGYSLQLGRGAVIAQRTGIPTVTNFRAADIAWGGQGAPLVPRVDAYLLSHPQWNRCIQNLGGMGNVTYLPAQGKIGNPADQRAWEQQVLGWDTGPGNVLIDLAVQRLSGGNLAYDRNGDWAATGIPDRALVDRWLEGSFFQQPPPKSTGRELFGTAYLEQCWSDILAAGLTEASGLATLTELTVQSIVQSYQRDLPHLPDQIFLCGGGSANAYLQGRLQASFPSTPILRTDAAGIPADFKEAIAFAVLAYWRQQGIPGTLPAVTGANSAAILGDWCNPNPKRLE